MTGRVERLIGVAGALSVIAVDQAAKAWIVAALTGPPRTVAVAGWFNLVPSFNRGVSFSLLQSRATWAPYVLIAVEAMIACALVVWLFRLRGRLLAAGVGLVLGGALGNLLDRIRIQAVVDFIQLHALGWYFPTFNLADCAIFSGVALILCNGLFERPTKPM